MLEFLSMPWHWAIAGTIAGLIVPALLLLGNKQFGISSNLRHICAACFPANVKFFHYNWKKEVWNLYFVVGILVGAIIAQYVLTNPEPVQLNPKTVEELKTLGVKDFQNLMPTDLFSFANLLTLQGWIFIVLGGFLVGFGTRYAGGCTSGHTIMGLSSLQWPSLVASICFMVGGFLVTHLVYPFLF